MVTTSSPTSLAMQLSKSLQVNFETNELEDFGPLFYGQAKFCYRFATIYF